MVRAAAGLRHLLRPLRGGLPRQRPRRPGARPPPPREARSGRSRAAPCPSRTARAAAACLLALGLLCGLGASARLLRLRCSRTSPLNLAYSFGLKHVVILDVLAIAIGFVAAGGGGGRRHRRRVQRLAARLHDPPRALPRPRQAPARARDARERRGPPPDPRRVQPVPARPDDRGGDRLLPHRLRVLHAGPGDGREVPDRPARPDHPLRDLRDLPLSLPRPSQGAGGQPERRAAHRPAAARGRRPVGGGGGADRLHRARAAGAAGATERGARHELRDRRPRAWTSSELLADVHNRIEERRQAGLYTDEELRYIAERAARGGAHAGATCGPTSSTSSAPGTRSGTSPSTPRRSTARAAGFVGRALETARRALRPVQKLFWNPNPDDRGPLAPVRPQPLLRPPPPQPGPGADAASTSRCRSCATATCSCRAASRRSRAGRRRSRTWWPTATKGARRTGAREGPPAARRALATATRSATRRWRSSAQLRAAGHESDIFAELVHPRVAHLARPLWEYREVSSPDTVCLFHFSIGSAAGRLIHHAPDRLVIVYHNITPAHFFLGFHPHLAGLCHHGRRELAAFAPRTELALGRQRVQPPRARGGRLRAHGRAAHRARPLALRRGRPRRSCGGLYDDGRTNVLFVGRIIPNKRIDDLVRSFAVFQRWLRPAQPPAARGRPPGLRALLRPAAGAGARAAAWTRSSSRARWTTTSSTPTTGWPTSSCASPSTRASACRCRRRCTSACRWSPTTRARCGRRCAAGGCCCRTSGPSWWRSSSTASPAAASCGAAVLASQATGDRGDPRDRLRRAAAGR